jgi:hypothetical protein
VFTPVRPCPRSNAPRLRTIESRLMRLGRREGLCEGLIDASGSSSRWLGSLRRGDASSGETSPPAGPASLASASAGENR